MLHNESRPGRVLIAAVDEGFRRQQAIWLAERGLATVEAADGVQALQILQQCQIGAALVAADLPALSGLELLRETHRAGLTVPLILFTHSWNIQRAIEAMREGAWNYLTSPYQKKELLDTVEAALNWANNMQAPWGWRVRSDRKHVRKLEFLGRIAGGIIHDFNNLLTVIQGLGQVLRDRADIGAPWQNYLLDMVSAADRGAELIEQLFLFCRERPIKIRLCDVNDAVTKMQMMLARLIDERIQIVNYLDEDLGPILANPCQLEQIIMNLVLNASDAVPKGGLIILETANLDLPNSHFPFTALPPGSYVMLSVRDTGTGMDAESKSQLFERLDTTKGDLGNVLGFFNVQRVIRSSGGQIIYKSEPGQGAMFTILWPRAAGPATALQSCRGSVICGGGLNSGPDGSDAALDRGFAQ